MINTWKFLRRWTLRNDLKNTLGCLKDVWGIRNVCLSFLLMALPWEVAEQFLCVKHNENKTLNPLKGSSSWVGLGVWILSDHARVLGPEWLLASGLTGCIILWRQAAQSIKLSDNIQRLPSRAPEQRIQRSSLSSASRHGDATWSLLDERRHKEAWCSGCLCFWCARLCWDKRRHIAQQELLLAGYKHFRKGRLGPRLRHYRISGATMEARST